MGILSKNDKNAWPISLWLLAALAAIATIAIVAADPGGRVLAGNTLALCASVAAASVAFGTPLAFAIARTDIFGRTTAAALLVALLFMPLYLQAAAWQAGFGLSGWYTSLAGEPVLLDRWRGAIFVHTLASIPWVVAIVAIGLLLSEPELEEDALLDATPGQVFWRVTLPRSAGAILAAALWVAVTTAGEMTVTDLFLVRTYAEQIYTEYAVGDTLDSPGWKLSSSLAVAAWIALAAAALVRQIAPDRYPSQRAAFRFKLGPWRTAASLATLGTVGLMVAVPVGNLLAKAGLYVTRDGQTLARHWSLGQCAATVAAAPARFADEFGWSLLVASLAATTAVIIGLVLAWNARDGFVSARSGWRGAPCWLVIALCLATPGPVVGLAVIACFGAADWPWLVYLYDRTIVPVWLAQTVRVLPVATLVLWYALRSIPLDLLQSATLDGAGPMTRLLRVALPQRLPALGLALLVALALAWAELPASILTVPPGIVTLPIQVFGLIHYGADDQVAGVSLLTMALVFALAIGLTAVWRRVIARE